VEENIALPLLLAGESDASARRQAATLAEAVGLDHRLRHQPHQLSGGECQRVAIARAVIHKPALVVADEPTGSLDSQNGARIMDLLSRLHPDHGLTILLATHDAQVASKAHRILKMKDGRWEETPSPALPSA
jgi:putative ABC transport system ATP-binding protein